MTTLIINATEFKAKCLALLDEVDAHSRTITVTKRGRPVAILGPAKKAAWKSPRGSCAGKVEINGDIENVDTAELWDVVRRK